MLILAKLIGVVIAVFGLTIFATPQITKRVFDFFKEGKNIYWAGVVRVLIGLVLLLAAAHSAIPVATICVGVIFLLSGIIVFAVDLEKMKNFIAYFDEMPALVTRLLGLLAASFGILIFSII